MKSHLIVKIAEVCAILIHANVFWNIIKHQIKFYSVGLWERKMIKWWITIFLKAAIVIHQRHKLMSLTYFKLLLWFFLLIIWFSSVAYEIVKIPFVWHIKAVTISSCLPYSLVFFQSLCSSDSQLLRVSSSPCHAVSWFCDIAHVFPFSWHVLPTFLYLTRIHPSRQLRNHPKAELEHPSWVSKAPYAYF